MEELITVRDITDDVVMAFVESLEEQINLKTADHEVYKMVEDMWGDIEDVLMPITCVEDSGVVGKVLENYFKFGEFF